MATHFQIVILLMKVFWSTAERSAFYVILAEASKVEPKDRANVLWCWAIYHQRSLAYIGVITAPWGKPCSNPQYVFFFVSWGLMGLIYHTFYVAAVIPQVLYDHLQNIFYVSFVRSWFKLKIKEANFRCHEFQQTRTISFRNSWIFLTERLVNLYCTEH